MRAMQGGFVTFHALARYVKVTLFKGARLDPLPSGATPRSGEARWIDFTKAGSTKPGWRTG